MSKRVVQQPYNPDGVKAVTGLTCSSRDQLRIFWLSYRTVCMEKGYVLVCVFLCTHG